jgi:hypothetical protein
LLLYNIADKELTAGELRTRGCYLGEHLLQCQEIGRNRLFASCALAD